MDRVSSKTGHYFRLVGAVASCIVAFDGLVHEIAGQFSGHFGLRYSLNQDLNRLTISLRYPRNPASFKKFELFE